MLNLTSGGGVFLCGPYRMRPMLNVAEELEGVEYLAARAAAFEAFASTVIWAE